MTHKDTDDLQQELMETPDLNSFLKDNEDNFSDQSAQELLGRLFEKRKLSKAALAKYSGMSEIYLHQVFSGRRNPSRSRLICLCYGLNATLKETQELLGFSGHARLYPKIKRDAIIIYGLVHGIDLFDVNDKLFEANEETLF